jgi:hypothetical protein
MTPFELACYHGSCERVVELLAESPSPAVLCEGLYLSIQERRFDVAEFLLLQNVCDLRSTLFFSPILICAVETGNVPLVKLVLRKNNGEYAVATEGVLLWYCTQPYERAMFQLLCSIDTRRRTLLEALDEAVRSRNASAAEHILLLPSLSPYIPPNETTFFLKLFASCVRYKLCTVAHLLLWKGLDITESTYWAKRTLLEACQNNDVKMLMLLLDYGCPAPSYIDDFWSMQSESSNEFGDVLDKVFIHRKNAERGFVDALELQFLKMYDGLPIHPSQWMQRLRPHYHWEMSAKICSKLQTQVLGTPLYNEALLFKCLPYISTFHRQKFIKFVEAKLKEEKWCCKIIASSTLPLCLQPTILSYLGAIHPTSLNVHLASWL